MRAHAQQRNALCESWFWESHSFQELQMHLWIGKCVINDTREFHLRHWFLLQNAPVLSFEHRTPITEAQFTELINICWWINIYWSYRLQWCSLLKARVLECLSCFSRWQIKVATRAGAQLYSSSSFAFFAHTFFAHTCSISPFWTTTHPLLAAAHS